MRPRGIGVAMADNQSFNPELEAQARIAWNAIFKVPAMLTLTEKQALQRLGLDTTPAQSTDNLVGARQ